MLYAAAMEERARVEWVEEWFQVEEARAEREAHAGRGPDAHFRRVQDGQASRYVAAGWVENLSLGGAFVRTAAPLAAETGIELALRLQAGALVTTPAVVLFTELRGMAVRFVLDREGIAALHEYLTRPSRQEWSRCLSLAPPARPGPCPSVPRG